MTSTGESVTCGSCATPADLEAAFCGVCGARLAQSGTPPADAGPALAPVVHRPKLVVSFDDESTALVPVPAPRGQGLAGLPPASPTGPLPAVAEPIDHPAYTACTIREVFEDQFSAEDGLIFPVPAMEADTVVLEPRDGRDVRRVLCNEVQVKVGQNNERLLRAPEIRAQVLITDARLTVACSKFDKGGGWVGGPVAMIALNAGSKLLAARRRRGKMLVGQVRYPWIHAVYAQNKAGWTGSEMIRILVKSGDEPMRLELTFPKDVDATAVATELICRAARFRLMYEPDLGAKERSELSELAEIPPLVWRRGEGNMVGRQFPSHWPAAPRSARFGLPGGGA